MTIETAPAAAPAVAETAPAVTAESTTSVTDTPPASAADTTQQPDGDKPSETGPDAAEAERKRQARDGNSTSYWRRQAEKAQRQIEREREYRDRVTERLLDTQNPAQQRRPETVAAPKQDDYPDFEAYLIARAKHAVVPEVRAELMREIESVQKQRVESERQEQVKQSSAEFLRKCQAAAPRYADYDEIAGSVLSDPGFPVSNAMAEVIRESDKGPDLLYWLGSHPEEAAKLSRLSPLAAARELGRVESTLSAPPKKTVTQAPNPPPTLKGSNSAPPDIAGLAKKDDASDLIALWRTKKA